MSIQRVLTRTAQVAALALVCVVAPVANATATFQGLFFTFIQVDADTLTFEVSGTPSGDWSGVQYLGDFNLKGLGLDLSPGHATGTANGPGAVNLLGLNSQLSASNLDCSQATGDKGSICFDVSPDLLLGSLPFDFLYTIDFSQNLNIDPAGVHLQIAFMNVQGGKKVGSLYSQDVLPGDECCQRVPEPGTLLLLGVALAGLGFSRRWMASSLEA